MSFFISKDDQRIDQFTKKLDACAMAERQTKQTGRKHQAFLTTTYRDCSPKLCWTVVLQLHYNANGGLTTK